MKRLLIKLLFRAVLNFVGKISSDITYREDSRIQVIGGGSDAFFIPINNDPRGTHLGLQIYWSFETRPCGSVCSQHAPDNKPERIPYDEQALKKLNKL